MANPPRQITCPHPGCQEAYGCEGCINQHLRAEHGLRYGDVFGPQDPGMVNFCKSHAELTPSALGI